MIGGQAVDTLGPEHRGAIQYRFVVLSLALIAICWGFFDTIASLVKIWNESETFAHGYLILPISLYIIWENRERLYGKEFETFPFAAVLIFGAGGVWWLAKVIDVQVVQQFAFVAVCVLTVVFFLGLKAARQLVFPLLFLFLAVPFGNGLIPHMIDMTADFVVFAIRIVGIPVYREGTHFIMPTGSWSVVSGCSGMRYLMATITVGLLFAYMNYRSVKRRVMFMIVACLVALIANWLRAFGIVMIAHYSGMKLALGVDHYIYGWVFFGIIVFALMGVGRIWQEEPLAVDISKDSGAKQQLVGVPISFGASLLALLVLLFWPIFYLVSTDSAGDDFAAPQFAQLTDSGQWRRLEEHITDWKPEIIGARHEIKLTYSRDGSKPVEFFVGWYPEQNPDAEIINARNRLIHEKDSVWKYHRHGIRDLGGTSGVESVFERSLESNTQNLLVWQWYWIAGNSTTSNLHGKIHQAVARLTGRNDGGAFIVVYTEIEETDASREAGVGRLSEFVMEFNDEIESRFERALNADTK